jgi:tyrosine-specific transport protein
MLLRLIGSILLIIGTSIGAGLLALPMVTSAAGFYYACGLLLVCWAVMTMGAFYLLEVNLRMPTNSNMVTMAKHTLGKPGQIGSWIIYLCLLYSLISAYLAGGSDVLSTLFKLAHFHIAHWGTTLIFVAVLGTVVYQGIRTVDVTNRFLMTAKILIFILAVALIVPHIHVNYYKQSKGITALYSAIMVVITSFGFSTIVPSLRTYLNNDVKKLRIAILAGSLIALACYIVWIFTVQGIIASEGPHGLIKIAGDSNSVGHMITGLTTRLHSPTIASFAHTFASICMITSFLGVSLCLTDFLADGLSIKKKGKGNVFIFLLTFLPPVLLVIFDPSIFIAALEYAGVFCVLLLILLPALMTWQIRKKKHDGEVYQVWGGKLIILLTLAISLVLLVVAFCQA